MAKVSTRFENPTSRLVPMAAATVDVWRAAISPARDKAIDPSRPGLKGLGVSLKLDDGRRIEVEFTRAELADIAKQAELFAATYGWDDAS